MHFQEKKNTLNVLLIKMSMFEEKKIQWYFYDKSLKTVDEMKEDKMSTVMPRCEEKNGKGNIELISFYLKA